MPSAQASARTDALLRRLKASPTQPRLAILHGLRDGTAITEIAASFAPAQPTVSNHVKVLRNVGPVTDDRDGTRLVVRPDVVEELLANLTEVLIAQPSRLRTSCPRESARSAAAEDRENSVMATTLTRGPQRLRFTPRRVLWSLDRTRSTQLWDEFGVLARDDGVVAFRFAGDRAWVVTDPAWTRQVLTAGYDAVARSGSFRKLGVFLGDGLLTTDGPAHRLRRRQVQPAFHRERLHVYAESMVAAAQATDRLWQGGQQVAMDQQMAALTMDAIGRAVLGVDGREAAPAVGGALDRLLRAMPLMFIPNFERVALRPLPGLRWLREAFAVLDSVARNAAARSEAELVQTLRTAAADVPELSEEEVRDELLILLLAGHETTATTLTWAWWLLDRHPRVADRLRDEVASVVGDRPPTYDDVDRLAYTQAVVAETLRMRPAAWVIERQVVGPFELGPFRPPPGTLLLLAPWLLHRDPRSWGDPDEFRPERWIAADGKYSENAPGQPRGAYLPFGAGAHVCIGASFAWTEAVLALAVLAPRWRPALVPGASVGIRASITLRPADGMPMVVHAAR